jgi:hypothetical protein
MSARKAAPAGMRAAAAAWMGTAVHAEDGAVQVGAATVRATAAGLSCDCPMGDAPACLHRLVVVGPSERRTPSVAPSVRRPIARSAGERLPEQDAARFAPLLAEAEALVAEVLTVGIARAATTVEPMIRGLAARTGAERPRPAAPREAALGRLSRALGALAAYLSEARAGEALPAEAAALRELSLVRNLVRALRANTGALPLGDVAGGLRREYAEVPALEVQGLGLEAWTAPGGAVGVTAYVAVLGEERVLARTVVHAGNRIEAVEGPPAWAKELSQRPAFASSGVTLRDLSRGRFLLAGARVSASAGLLSGSATTSATPLEPLLPEDPRMAPFVLQSAADARCLSARLAFDALDRPAGSLLVALLPIEGMSPSDFDPVTQRLSLRLLAAQGRELSVSLPFRAGQGFFFDNLEVLSRAARPPRWLLVRLGREGAALSIEPLTAHLDGPVPVHLTLDALGDEIISEIA